VRDGDADPALGGRSVEVSGDESLAEQRHAVRPRLVSSRLGAAAAAMAAPPSPDASRARAAEPPDGAQGLVARPGPGAVRLPGRDVASGWDDRLRPTSRDGVAAGSAVIGAVGGDRGDRLVLGNLRQQARGHWRVAHAAAVHLLSRTGGVRL
jgi:hypothetical protein